MEELSVGVNGYGSGIILCRWNVNNPFGLLMSQTIKRCTRGTVLPLLAVLFCAAFPAFAQERTVTVKSVHTAKVLELSDGSLLRLAAVQAPNRARNEFEVSEPLAQEAYETTRALAEGKTLRIVPMGDGEDRRGREVAMAYDGDVWLQAELLRRGMAWVYTFEDSRSYAPALLAAEREAEAAGRGIWAEQGYAVLTPEEAVEHAGEFHLVRGQVHEVAVVRGRYYVNFGEDWKTDFTLFIDKAAAANFAPEWLASLKGKTIRVRGWLFERNGPAIELTHPEQVEILP